MEKLILLQPDDAQLIATVANATTVELAVELALAQASDVFAHRAAWIPRDQR